MSIDVEWDATLRSQQAARESALRGVVVTWNLTDDRQCNGLPPKIIEAQKKRLEENFLQMAARNGIHDPAEIARLVAQVHRKAEQTFGFSHRISESQMEIENTPELLRISGSQEMLSLAPDAQYTRLLSDYYFLNGVGVGMNHPSEPAQEPMSLVAQVWSSEGRAEYFRKSDSAPHLQVQPEEIVALAGLNPLDLYGVVWTYCPYENEIICLATVTQGPDSPFDLEVVLDRRHDNTPVHFRFKKVLPNEVWTLAVDVSDLVRVNDQWVGQHVSSVYTSRLHLRKRECRLATRRPVTEPGALRLPTGVDVMDMRLIGPANAFTYEQRSQATQANGAPIVHYKWAGCLPSEADLKGMRARYPN